MNRFHNNSRQLGFSMIEVLITLVILLVGLLGLAGLMVQSQRSEMESYQRMQAMILLQDMVSRINANRKAATCYSFTTALNGAPYLGTASTMTPVAASQCTQVKVNAIYPALTAAQATAAAQTALTDLTTWHNALLGAAEVQGANSVGAMIGARGCISYDATQEITNPVTLAPIAGSGVYTVSVAWQGMGGTFANATQLCGTNQYLNAQNAADETVRRVVSVTMRIADLTAP